MSNKQNDEIIEKQKYTYTVTEQSVDERITEISSTVKLTWDEIQSIYLGIVQLSSQAYHISTRTHLLHLLFYP